MEFRVLGSRLGFNPLSPKPPKTLTLFRIRGLHFEAPGLVVVQDLGIMSHSLNASIPSNNPYNSRLYGFREFGA